MVKSITLTDEDPLGQDGSELANAFERLIFQKLLEMKARGERSTANHLYVTTLAIGTAMNMAAKVITMPTEDDINHPKVQKWFSEPSNRAAVLVASLLVARCTKPVLRDNGQAIDFEYGPSHMRAAIEAAETLLGHPIRQDLCQPMVQAAFEQPPASHLFDNSNTKVIYHDGFKTTLH